MDHCTLPGLSFVADFLAGIGHPARCSAARNHVNPKMVRSGKKIAPRHQPAFLVKSAGWRQYLDASWAQSAKPLSIQ
jgi:hypothetical protein